MRIYWLLRNPALIIFFCMCAIYGLLTKCEVTMAGYWPSSFFARLWTETKSRSINAQKRTRPISSHLDQTSLVNKGFSLYGFRGNFSCGIQRVVLSQQDSSILPARVAIHNRDLVHLVRSRSQPYDKLQNSPAREENCVIPAVNETASLKIKAALY